MNEDKKPQKQKPQSRNQARRVKRLERIATEQDPLTLKGLRIDSMTDVETSAERNNRELNEAQRAMSSYREVSGEPEPVVSTDPVSQTEQVPDIKPPKPPTSSVGRSKLRRGKQEETTTDGEEE